MTRTRSILIFVLLALLGVFAYQTYGRLREAHFRRLGEERHAAYLKEMKPILERRAAIEHRREAQPQADLQMDQYALVYGTYRKPASAWIDAQKAFYAALLAKGKFDVLVVPFQVEAYSLGRSVRSLMTADLALALAAADIKVPDPYLVARALGDGKRRFDPADVYRLATALGVRRIVWGYTGFDRNHKMNFMIQYQDRTAKNPLGPDSYINFRNFDYLPFSDEKPPTAVFHSMLPEVLKLLGVQENIPKPRDARERSRRYDLPATPLGLIASPEDAARDAAYLQLLAALTPRHADRTRERFVEKSMLAVMNLAPGAPDYRLLKARALMLMSMRPEALSALGQPSTPEEQELKAFLNGNLPDVERYAERIKPGLYSLIAALDVNAIRTAYEARTRLESSRIAKSFELPGEDWRLLVYRAMTEWDDWSQYRNAPVKQLLDREYPLPGYSLHSMLVGAESLGSDADKAQTMVDLSVLDHVRKYEDKKAQEWCCAPLRPRVTALDYLDLLEAIGTDNIMRGAKFLSTVQGQPDDALRYLTRYESVYRDHPQFVEARATAEVGAAARTEGSQRDSLLRSAYQDAVNAMYWEQAQTHTVAEAMQTISDTQRADYGIFNNFYVTDYPFRSFYPDNEMGGSLTLGIFNARRALRDSTIDITPVERLAYMLGEVQNKWDQVDELLKSIGDRFAGNANLMILMAQSSERQGDLQSAERDYREGLKIHPRDWQPYREFGKLLFEAGKSAEAERAFLGYPGFRKGSGENEVGLSNYAFEAGSLFFLSGEFDLAKPLYSISAKLETGSDAGLTSEARLDLMARDYEAAERINLARAEQYHSVYAFRDYLGMQFAAGHSGRAWSAFKALVQQQDRPQVWAAALVGHRLEGATEHDIARWAAQEPMHSAGTMVGYAAMYLLRAGVTDRVPTAGLAASIAAIERPVYQLSDPHHFVVRTTPTGERQMVLGPKAPKEGVLPMGTFEESARTRVKSELVYFAEAYRAIRRNRYAEAQTGLQEASALYDFANPGISYFLPYYAIAAAKTGHREEFAAVMDRVPAENRRFDYYLAQAVLDATARHTKAARHALELALHRRPNTESRPLFTEYEYADLCQWLYGATRDAEYRKRALGWARSVEVMDPWYAWPYALDAKLSSDGAARRHAIAMAYYLDKGSHWLAAVPWRQVESAVRESAGRNPFRHRRNNTGLPAA